MITPWWESGNFYLQLRVPNQEKKYRFIELIMPQFLVKKLKRCYFPLYTTKCLSDFLTQTEVEFLLIFKSTFIVENLY